MFTGYSSLAVFVALCGLVVIPLLQRMPAPFDDSTAVLMSTDQIELLAGNSRGPPVTPRLTGALAPNNKLKQARRLFKGKVLGAESVAVMPNGELLMLDRAGYLYRASPTKSGDDFELQTDDPLYIGPGRPLGYHIVDGGKTMLVCDSLKGLIEVSLKSGEIRILVNTRPDRTPLTYANDLDIAADGTVYFTSSVQGTVAHSPQGFYDTMRSFLLNSFRGDRTGVLLSYDRQTHKTRELARGIFYANGVAVAADHSFVAVAETNAHRVLRHWLSGPKKGSTDVLIDKLPGYPDGITTATDGNMWVCLIAKPSPILRYFARYPMLRTLFSHALPSLAPVFMDAKKWGAVVKVSPTGEIVDALYDLDGQVVSGISAVVEHNGRLFFGNLGGDYVSVYKLEEGSDAR